MVSLELILSQLMGFIYSFSHEVQETLALINTIRACDFKQPILYIVLFTIEIVTQEEL